MTKKISAELAAILAVADDGTHTEINKFGTKIWYNADGMLHRDGDLPAVIYADGDVYYYKNGKKHRDGDLPAMIYANGDVFYYKDGMRHRDGDLPAVIYANGDVFYYKDGMRHRDGDLPASIWSDGTLVYYKHDKHYTPTTKTKSSSPARTVDGGDLIATLKTEIVAVGFTDNEGKLRLIRCTTNPDYIRVRMILNKEKSSDDYQDGNLVIWDIDTDTCVSFDENSVIVWGVIK